MAEATMAGAPSIARASKKYRRFTVDLWATSLNDLEIGIYQQSRHRAKSSQFTKDMDVIGQITEDGERTGVVAYRAGLWDKAEGTKRRLVLKLFSDTMNWRATMDMMVGRSLQLTLGADGVPITAYSINVARNDHVVQLERSADKWMFWPEKFSFFILDDEGPRYYKLRQNLFSIGADYNIYDEHNKKIGALDGKVLSFGGVWYVKLRADHKDKKLDAALQLFCSMLRFNKSARRHIDALATNMRRGGTALDLDHYEKDLYMNPRRTR